MPPVIRGRLNLDPEDQPVWDSSVFADTSPSDAFQVRRGGVAGPIPDAINFQDLLNQNRGATNNLFNRSLAKLKSIPGQLKPNEEKVDYLKGIAADAVNAIRGPLGYNNPTVAVGSSLAGQRINPEALSWIREQEKIIPIGELDAMGGTVKAENYRPQGGPNIIDIAFRNPAGYVKPSDIKERIKELENEGEKKFDESMGESGSYKQMLISLERELERSKGNPLMREAIRYQLGRAIDNAPEGTQLKAIPIGGAKGERARVYRMLSKGALETKPFIEPNYSRMPSEDEFTNAREYHGGSGSVNSLNYNANSINTTKTGPQEFVTATNKTVAWNPAKLKDPMIRAAFNLDEKTDVSSLRADPMGQFLNKGFVDPQGYIDFNKTIITPNSPLYRAGRGIVNASKVGVTDFIPSREVVSNLYNNQPLEAVKNYASEFIGGIPQALAVGGAIAAAPALAPVATTVGGSIAIAKAANAVDEAYRQTTGKSWMQRNQPASPNSTYTGPTPTIQPRTGTAILGGKPVQVPYGSVAGQRKVGRPWWDTAGSRFQSLLNSFSPIIGR
jgi:hypothetical protein